MGLVTSGLETTLEDRLIGHFYQSKQVIAEVRPRDASLLFATLSPVHSLCFFLPLPPSIGLHATLLSKQPTESRYYDEMRGHRPSRPCLHNGADDQEVQHEQ